MVGGRGALDTRRSESGILPVSRACDSLTDRMRPATDLLVALLVALAVQGCARAQAPQPAPAPQVPMRHVLPNGVRVIIQELRSSEVVAVQLWVRAGSRDETTSELGLAHYLEHMLFKGTTSRARGFVERDVEGVGGRANAGTSLDYTFYHAVLPRARTIQTIEMLADISVNSVLDETELELEKKVVLEEMRVTEDSPQRYLVRQLYGVVFGAHPYGRSGLGTPKIIQALTRGTLLSFYRRYYVPESFALVVVGPVDPAETLRAAERSLGRLPRSGFQRLPAPAPASLTPKKVDVPRPGALAYLGLGWLGPKLDHADTPAVELLVSILGQSRSSRLPQSLRERLALVNSVGSDYAALEAAGVITVMAQLEPSNLARAEAEILKEVQRVREQGVTNAELRRAITLAEADHAFRSETAEGRARLFGRAETVWRLAEELAYIDRLRTVTAEQVRLMARRYLDPERYGRLAFVPPPR
jgi:zinc protease